VSPLERPRTARDLNLDVDSLHHLVGGWQDEEIDTWPAVWSLRDRRFEDLAGRHASRGRPWRATAS
jgi:hypothetical protein